MVTSRFSDPDWRWIFVSDRQQVINGLTSEETFKTSNGRHLASLGLLYSRATESWQVFRTFFSFRGKSLPDISGYPFARFKDELQDRHPSLSEIHTLSLSLFLSIYFCFYILLFLPMNVARLAAKFTAAKISGTIALRHVDPDTEISLRESRWILNASSI